MPFRIHCFLLLLCIVIHRRNIYIPIVIVLLCFQLFHFTVLLSELLQVLLVFCVQPSAIAEYNNCFLCLKLFLCFLTVSVSMLFVIYFHILMLQLLLLSRLLSCVHTFQFSKSQAPRTSVSNFFPIQSNLRLDRSFTYSFLSRCSLYFYSLVVVLDSPLVVLSWFLILHGILIEATNSLQLVPHSLPCFFILTFIVMIIVAIFNIKQ